MPVRSSLPEDKVAALKAARCVKPTVKLGERRIAVVVDIEPVLFGGGALARSSDAVQVVRPSSVLGQIRFFWRLLQNSKTTLEDLQTREARIFGWASKAAPFSLAVDVLSTGALVDVPKMTEEGGYIAFAARSERGDHSKPEVKAADLRKGVQARITLHLGLSGADADELLIAIEAWLLLGGVGARTRRGLGAVQRIEGGPASLDALKARLAAFPAHGKPKAGGVRSIAQIWVGDKDYARAAECVYALEKWYKDYRQHRRTKNGKPFGRSYWDEPELIRGVTGQRMPRHQALSNPPPPTGHAPGWARAVLGLPIVTKFKDDLEGDPAKTTIRGAEPKLDRMASPLLFRAVRVGKDRYHPVVVLLGPPYAPPGGIALEVKANGKSNLRAIQLTAQVQKVFDDLLAAGKGLRLTRVTPK